MGSLRPLTLLFLCACARTAAPAPAHEEGQTAQKAEKAEKALWLCRPDRADDPCLRADLTVTELHPDGTRSTAPRSAVENATADCFYVYPTVDLDLVPRNHEDLSDTRRMLAVTLAQAGGFRETCALWAPLYRQVTIGTYLQPREEREKRLARAFEDVERAFREYLSLVPPNRKIVVVGHSQGGEMVIRLLRKYFDGDANAAMRERLVLGMPIGAEVEVPVGASAGATFTNLPVCTRPLETKCIVAYRTHMSGTHVDPDRWAPKPGNETVCVDPASLDAPGAKLASAVFPTTDAWGNRVRGLEDVTTPFAARSSFYSAACTRGDRGYAYLGVDFDDARIDRLYAKTKLGLHILDMQLPQGDLVSLVRRRVSVTRNRPRRAPSRRRVARGRHPSRP
jgi:hypothetical protein